MSLVEKDGNAFGRVRQATNRAGVPDEEVSGLSGRRPATTTSCASNPMSAADDSVVAMKIVSSRVTSYKSATDSGQFSLEPDVTCLVGKNESGKTAVLEAMYRVEPLPTGHPEEFDELRDYPRRYRSRMHDEIPDTHAVTLTVELEADDIAAVEAEFGSGALTSGTATISKDYSNRRGWNISTDGVALMRALLERAGVDASRADGAASQDELVEKLQAWSNAPEIVATLLSELEEHKVLNRLEDFLSDRLPGFLYFDEYSTMPGVVSIRQLQSTAEADLDRGERTALALLRLARVESKEFTEAEYEPRKAALEAAANQLTDEVFEYWSQNPDLSVELDVDFRPDGAGGTEPFLQVRIKNSRHRVTLNFGERSAGFVWFFSFLAAFSEFRDSDEPIVLLLDEPGLGLHAAAQEDLLRFIDEKLAPRHQVIYTTHSPFMVQPTKLHRARTVEDVNDEGTKVRDDVMSTSKETVFPLQAALGYELAQTLFLGPDNLVVEGPADLIYLQLISDYAESQGKPHLDDRWVIVPAGGLDKVPTFISLIGAQLNVVALVDIAGAGPQKIADLVKRGVIEQRRIIPVTEFTDTSEADLEDLFDDTFYLHLLRSSGTVSVKKADLKGGGRIIRQVEAAADGSFSHYKPARYFLQNQGDLLTKVGEEALERFVALFERVNTLLT